MVARGGGGAEAEGEGADFSKSQLERRLSTKSGNDGRGGSRSFKKSQKVEANMHSQWCILLKKEQKL